MNVSTKPGLRPEIVQKMTIGRVCKICAVAALFGSLVLTQQAIAATDMDDVKKFTKPMCADMAKQANAGKRTVEFKECGGDIVQLGK